MKKYKMFKILLAAVLAAASLTACGADSAETVGGAPPEQDRGQEQDGRQGQDGRPQAFSEEGGTMAKVVSLDGDRLTVILADMPARDGRNGTPPAIGDRPENGTPPAMSAQPGATAGDPSTNGGPGPNGDQGPGGDADRPDGAAPPNGGNSSEAPASGAAIDGPGTMAGDQAPAGDQGRPDGTGGAGRGGGNIEFAGEEVAYTLSGNLKITKGWGDSAAEIDLSELVAGDLIRFTTITGDDGKEKIETIMVLE